MKKFILTLITFMTILGAQAQKWTPTAITPISYNDLANVRSYAFLGNKIYIAAGNATFRTMVLSYDTTTQVLDTLPGAADLPINSTRLFLGPDSILWIVGKGILCDSVIWHTKLNPAGPTYTLPLWGPRHRPNPGKYAWVESVGFLGADIYFAGRFDSLGNSKWPNFVRYSAGGIWNLPNQAALVNVNVNGTSNSNAAAKIAKISGTNELMVTFPFRSDSVVVLTSQLGGYVQKLDNPQVVGIGSSLLNNNVVSYKGDLYYSTYDLDSTSQDLSTRVIRKNHVTGQTELIARIFAQGGMLEGIASWDTLHNKLILVTILGNKMESITNKRFYPVMAFDSANFTPVIDTVVDSLMGGASFTQSQQQILFGKTVTAANGVLGLGFYRLTYVDTTAPTIILNGPDTIVIHKGDPFTDPSATATDDEDGNITSSIVVTGSVDTGTVGQYTITYTVTDAAGNTTVVTLIVIVDPANGINSLTNDYSSVVVYPDRFIVSGAVRNESVSVFTATGQQIALINYTNRAEFPFDGLAKGVYLAQISGEHKIFRFVVQ